METNSHLVELRNALEEVATKVLKPCISLDNAIQQLDSMIKARSMDIKELSKVDQVDVLFADLDGTLIKTKSGKQFPENKDDWELIPGILSAVSNSGAKILLIVSNQGGIEKGFIKEFEFKAKLIQIMQVFKDRCEIPVLGNYCKSNDPDDYMRKPNIGMIDRGMELVRAKGIKCTRVLMIGDASGLEGQFSDSDKVCAERANIPYMDIKDFFLKYGG